MADPEALFRWTKKRFMTSVDLMEHMAEKIDERHNLISSEGKVLLTRTERIESTIGTRIDVSSIESQAPTVWASIAVLGGLVEEIKASLSSLPGFEDVEKCATNFADELIKKARHEMHQALAELEIRMDTAQEKATKPLQNRSKSIEQNILLLAQGAAKLKDEIAAMRTTNNTIGAYTTNSSVARSEVDDLRTLWSLSLRKWGGYVSHRYPAQT
jgi:hypothetical protein